MPNKTKIDRYLEEKYGDIPFIDHKKFKKDITEELKNFLEKTPVGELPKILRKSSTERYKSTYIMSALLTTAMDFYLEKVEDKPEDFPKFKEYEIAIKEGKEKREEEARKKRIEDDKEKAEEDEKTTATVKKELTDIPDQEFSKNKKDEFLRKVESIKTKPAQELTKQIKQGIRPDHEGKDKDGKDITLTGVKINYYPYNNHFANKFGQYEYKDPVRTYFGTKDLNLLKKNPADRLHFTY